MSFKSFSIVRLLTTCLVSCLFSLTLVCTPISASGWNAVPLDLNATTELGGLEAGQSLGLRIEVPSAGKLTILATTPIDSAAPALGLSTDCEPGRTGSARVKNRSLRRISMAVGAGSHLFKVASQDLRSPLPRVKIRTIFTASIEGEEDPGEVEVDPDPFHGPIPCHGIEGEEDPGEVEVDPDPFQQPHTSRKQLLGGCHGIEGEEDPGEVEVDPDPFHQGTSRDRLTSTCHSIEGEEDPGEVEVDPDPFHGEDQGSIGRKWILPETSSSQLWMVSIDSAGRWTELYDQRGQRLEVSDDGIKRLLLPGTYFVKTEEGSDFRTGDAPSLQASPW